jgi:hypothetical protein
MVVKNPLDPSLRSICPFGLPGCFDPPVEGLLHWPNSHKISYEGMILHMLDEGCYAVNFHLISRVFRGFWQASRGDDGIGGLGLRQGFLISRARGSRLCFLSRGGSPISGL